MISISVFCIIFRCGYSMIKIIKIGGKEFSVFNAGRTFLPISRVMGVINEFGFRCLHHFRMRLQPDKNQKIGNKKFIIFTAANLLLT